MTCIILNVTVRALGRSYSFLQGSTQYDGLGHVWYDGKLWNGYDARSTVEAMQKASVLPLAEKGVVGRGVLIDMARHRGKQWLDKGETFTHIDLEAAAAAQGVTIEPHDILCIRTGWMKYWYELDDKESFYDGFCEPGLTYSRELVEWFQQREIPNLVTDTIANEVTYDPNSGVALPLHCALMRNLGVTLTEIAWLDDLADACAADNRWSIVAVLDWEMATLGDPLADVASTLVWWDGVRGLDSPVAAVPADVPGYPGRDHLLAAYGRQSDLDLAPLPWYLGFAFFKIAAIFEGIHFRAQQGLTVGEGFDRLGDMVPPLIERGHAALSGTP